MTCCRNGSQARAASRRVHEEEHSKATSGSRALHIKGRSAKESLQPDSVRKTQAPASPDPKSAPSLLSRIVAGRGYQMVMKRSLSSGFVSAAVGTPLWRSKTHRPEERASVRRVSTLLPRTNLSGASIPGLVLQHSPPQRVQSRKHSLLGKFSI